MVSIPRQGSMTCRHNGPARYALTMPATALAMNIQFTTKAITYSFCAGVKRSYPPGETMKTKMANNTFSALLLYYRGNACFNFRNSRLFHRRFCQNSRLFLKKI